MPTRRTFLLAGIAGASALAAAGWLRSARDASPTLFSSTSPPVLGPDALAVVRAVTPLFLDGALSEDAGLASAAVRQTVDNVGIAIAGLPPTAQQELAQLFALLGFAPARIALARVTPPWPEASADEIRAFLRGWRNSRFLMFRSAYAALHQLVFAAWYGNPDSWSAIGYPGPPRLEMG
jgi:hypothetical protein